MVYRYIPDLAAEVTIPPDGILSRTLHNDDQVKVVLFGFAAGQELSEHTASMPALLHVLQGEARLRLGADEMDAHAGTWVHMPPQLAHALFAKTAVTLLLVLLKSPPLAAAS